MAYYEDLDCTQATTHLPSTRAVVMWGALVLFALFWLVGAWQMGTPRVLIEKNSAGEWERVR